MATQKFNIKVGRSDGYYTVSIPALGIADYGKTKKELMKNLNSALSLAYMNFPPSLVTSTSSSILTPPNPSM